VSQDWVQGSTTDFHRSADQPAPDIVVSARAASSSLGNPRGAAEVLGVFTRLGLTSFGGPIAHLGYFREELVNRRKWVDDETYADVVALCQFLPGPASSQVGITMGLARAGYLGALAAWIGFTLPSAIALILFALSIDQLNIPLDSGWLHGLKVVAVAVVAQAVWGMAVNLCPDRARRTLAILAAIVLLVWTTAFSQVGVIVVAGVVGWRLLRDDNALPPVPLDIRVPRRVAVACLALFAGLLLVLPLLNRASSSEPLAMVDAFYRAGSLVFGGGHVVLPLLQSAVVPNGWVTNAEFIAGYGAAQAVPGPLFTFSAYLGAVKSGSPSGWLGGSLALVAIFLPSFLLVFGTLPFWNGLRARPGIQSALRGVNAAVVGILLAALYDPVFTSAIDGSTDVALGLGLFGLLVYWKLPPWMVVILGAVAGEALSRL
jgi:chromate transporter